MLDTTLNALVFLLKDWKVEFLLDSDLRPILRLTRHRDGANLFSFIQHDEDTIESLIERAREAVQKSSRTGIVSNEGTDIIRV